MTWSFPQNLPDHDCNVIFVLTDGISIRDYRGVFHCKTKEFLYFDKPTVRISPSVVLQWRYDR